MEEIKFINKPNISMNEKYNRYEPIMGNDYVVIDWMLGNTCNYSCTYCHPNIYGGTVPWPDVDIAFEFAKRTIDHYRSIGKDKIVWNLLGGEPTVWPKFEQFFRKVKEYDNNSLIRVLTNGSRTLRWWEKNKNLFDEIIISWHPERANYIHCTEVSNILAEAGVTTSIQVCMYPPLMDHCIDAAKYFHENSISSSVISKSLQETLIDDRTFVYDEEKIKEIRQYDGQPKKLHHEQRNTDDFEHDLNKSKINRPAFGKMMRFINTYTGEQEFIQGNETMSSGRNSWKGWMCNIGIETITIGLDGTVTSGSSCFGHINHGNIKNPMEIEYPTVGRICEYDWCSCILDVEVTKYRIK